jgi:hypothetical protein
MKKVLFLLVATVGMAFSQTLPTNYTISFGSGMNAYSTPSHFGYLAFATQIAENTSSVTTMEMYGNVARLRTGFSHDLATTGPATLFALADAGVATNATGNVGLSLSSGGGVRVVGSGIPYVKNVLKSGKSGFVFTTLLHKTALNNPDGSQGVQPTFTAGFYLKFGK